MFFSQFIHNRLTKWWQVNFTSTRSILDYSGFFFSTSRRSTFCRLTLWRTPLRRRDTSRRNSRIQCDANARSEKKLYSGDLNTKHLEYWTHWNTESFEVWIFNGSVFEWSVEWMNEWKFISLKQWYFYKWEKQVHVKCIDKTQMLVVND